MDFNRQIVSEMAVPQGYRESEAKSLGGHRTHQPSHTLLWAVGAVWSSKLQQLFMGVSENGVEPFHPSHSDRQNDD